jgi:hypothetical protein
VSDTAVRPRRGIIGKDKGVEVDLLSEVELLNAIGFLEEILGILALVREEGLEEIGEGLGEVLTRP